MDALWVPCRASLVVNSRVALDGVTCFGVMGADLKEEVLVVEILRPAAALCTGQSFLSAFAEPRTPLSFTPDPM